MDAPLNSSWSFEIDSIERWAFAKNLFTAQECDTIIQECKNYKMREGTTIGNTGNNFRKSNIVFITPIPELHWVYQRLTSSVLDLNSKFFNFDLSGFNEGLQFTEYVAPDGKYDYHVDKTYKNVIRKLSIVVQLSDPEHYEGGEFHYLDSVEPEVLLKERGSLLAFPSWAMHRVTPVTKGTRYSLVGWITGKPFK
jgi:PKHD-type hydroxylase